LAIHGLVERDNGDVIFEKVYEKEGLSLENVLRVLENYVLEEQLNLIGTMKIKVCFYNTSGT